jgi:hypothetical protein
VNATDYGYTDNYLSELTFIFSFQGMIVTADMRNYDAEGEVNITIDAISLLKFQVIVSVSLQ